MSVLRYMQTVLHLHKNCLIHKIFRQYITIIVHPQIFLTTVLYVSVCDQSGCSISFILHYYILSTFHNTGLVFLKRSVWLGVVMLDFFLCINTSRLKQKVIAKRFNYSTVVLISGNENQERFYVLYQLWQLYLRIKYNTGIEFQPPKTNCTSFCTAYLPRPQAQILPNAEAREASPE